MGNVVYRLDTPTLAVLTLESGLKTPLVVPEGAILRFTHSLDQDRLIDVLYDGKTVLMFAQDLRVRGALLRAAGA